jgi:tryptophan-rich sensory protein
LGGLAFVEIVVLWTLLLLIVTTFFRVRSLAGLLMLPYLAWVTLAVALTYAIWRRNPGIL